MVFNNGRLDEPVQFPKSDDEWHSFLEGKFEDALTIKRYVEDLPETAATFRLKRLRGELNTRPHNIDPRIVKLTGAWEAPKILSSVSGPNRFVNPNYEHAYHYSDCIVRCECGSALVRQRYDESEKMPTYHEEHAPSCTKMDRLETRAQILRKRKSSLEELYMLGHNVNSGMERLGYSYVGNNNVGMKEVEDWGVDLHELYVEGRQRLARTLLVLMRQYGTTRVAELYGISKETASKIVSHETVSDSMTLYKIRKAGKPVQPAD